MESDIKIRCETHGESSEAFVCQHLFAGESRGFHWSHDPDHPDALCPDAWCSECDDALEQAGEWTEEMMKRADIKLVCAQCYGVIRAKNWIQDDTAYRALVDSACAYLDAKQDAFIEEFQINSFDRWNWDQDRAQLVFSSDGKPGVICDIAFVGSFSEHGGTWMWSWANESHTEVAKSRMREVRDHGEEKNFERLAGAYWEAEQADGWEMTNIAAYLLNAVGAYRTPGDGSFTFMVILKASRAQ